MVTSSPIVQLVGELRAAPGQTLAPDHVRALLRARRVLGSVGQHDGDALTRAAELSADDLPVQIALALAVDENVLILEEGAARSGPTLGELCADLAAATHADVDIAGEFHSGMPFGEIPVERRGENTGESATENAEEQGGSDGEIVVVEMPERTDPVTVLLVRGQPNLLPLLARDAGSALSVAQLGDWALIKFDNADADTSNHGWLSSETPVIELSALDGNRYLTVLASRGILLQGATLTRLTAMTPTYQIAEVSTGEPQVTKILASLTNQHLDADSEMMRLLASPPFNETDPAVLAATLQLPDDEHWFARVLDVLGLPALAAEVFEGAELPGEVTRVEPGSLMTSLRAALHNYEHAEPGDVVRRGWFGRMSGALVRKPVLMLLTIIPESLLGVAALAWVGAAKERPWWMAGVAVLGSLALIDAAIDSVLMVGRLRRRKVRRA